jgi:hypothetical protein
MDYGKIGIINKNVSAIFPTSIIEKMIYECWQTLALSKLSKDIAVIFIIITSAYMSPLYSTPNIYYISLQVPED